MDGGFITTGKFQQSKECYTRIGQVLICIAAHIYLAIPLLVEFTFNKLHVSCIKQHQFSYTFMIFDWVKISKYIRIFIDIKDYKDKSSQKNQNCYFF